MIKRITVMALAIWTQCSVAKDFHITEGLFEQKVSLQGIVKPQNAAELAVSPKVWEDFVVTKFLPHGTKVKKGEPIFWVETDKIDHYIQLREHERSLEQLKIKRLGVELEEFKARGERELIAEKLKYERAAADYKYYKEVKLPNSVAKSTLRDESTQWVLQNAEEEMKQLLKMYAADGLTEDTEEIILEQAKNRVKRAKFNRAQSGLELEHQLKVLNTRAKEDHEVTFQSAANAWDRIKKLVPLSLEEKELNFAKLVLQDQKRAKEFEELKADRASMNIVAPIDGYLYYGVFDGINWQRDLAKKAAVKGAKLPNNQPFLTIVPSDAKLLVGASVDAFVASKIKKGSEGRSQVEASPWLRFPSEVLSVSDVPNIFGAWSVELEPELPKDLMLKSGEKMTVSFTTYRNEKALTVPVTALGENVDGSFFVRLKIADGETGKILVKLGLSSEGRVEVLGGLNSGQVIVYDN